MARVIVGPGRPLVPIERATPVPPADERDSMLEAQGSHLLMDHRDSATAGTEPDDAGHDLDRTSIDAGSSAVSCGARHSLRVARCD
jgi:hypothetical protein